MTLKPVFLALVVVLGLPNSVAYRSVTIDKAELGREFLLQTSYEQADSREDFNTSRSRIVTFERHGKRLRMIEKHRGMGLPDRALASIPIRGESPLTLAVDFNAGFDRVFREEDRTGEDYYGRSDREQDDSFITLTGRQLLNVSRDGAMLVLAQQGRDENGTSVVVHYYLSPYRPNEAFVPFELESLDHFGFYETYPRRVSGRIILYAMKFDSHKPIVFALSGIPAFYREAVRDGILYWNRAFGTPLLQVIDAPSGVTAPNPDYNVIQWIPEGDRASTSHIQSDPLTGEILHASIFLRPQMVEGEINERNDRWRYVVAHEVGHALGFRHNFAKGPAATVMNYFPFEETVRIGNDVIESGAGALEYDRKVARYVYLDEPLDLKTLPPFCTDHQDGCNPFGALTTDNDPGR